MRRLIAVIVVAAVFASRAFAASVEEVESAIRKGVEHLYQIQSGDNWDNDWKQDNSNTGGRTALVVYALLASGESPLAGSIGDYWWAGAFRTIFVIDPIRDMIAVLMANDNAYPFPRWFQLFRSLVYQALTA